MIDDKKLKVINILTDLYKTKGFVTEDEIFALTSKENLSIFDTNYVTEYLLSHGIIVSDNKEGIPTQKGRGKRRNYSKLFKKIASEYKGLKQFLKYYEKVEVLAEKEWIILLKQARQGNEWAKKRLFDTSMKKVISQVYAISKKFDLDFEDTLQLATFSILYAINNFDETEQTAFPGYVPLAVISGIQRTAYLHTNFLFSLPATFMIYFFKIYPLIKEHCCGECWNSNNQFHCSNLRNAIHKKIECTDEEIDEYIKYLQPREEIKENTIINNFDPIVSINKKEVKNAIISLLSHLKPQEEDVIRMRYGIDCEECSLEMIAQKKSVSRQRIQQIEIKALKHLSHVAINVLKYNNLF